MHVAALGRDGKDMLLLLETRMCKAYTTVCVLPLIHMEMAYGLEDEADAYMRV